MVKRHHILDFLLNHRGLVKLVGYHIRGGIAQLAQLGGQLQHRFPRLLQIVLPADNAGLDGHIQIPVVHRHDIAKFPLFVFVAGEDG